VKLSVSSKPAGAEVFLAATGVKLGRAPLVHEMSPSAGTVVFVVKLGGFRDARAELPADKDGAVKIDLEKLPEPRPVARVEKKPAAPAPTPAEKKPPRRTSIKDGQIDPFAQ
jgi:hypothetical protein